MQAEEALQQARAELAHVTRVTTIGQLTASIAHEVNQPLAAIVTNGNACLRWLAKDIPDLAEAREAAKRIVSDGHRAGNVIKSIRALARKSSSKVMQLDINDAIREVLFLIRTELRRHEVFLETDLFVGLEPVMGDRVQLQQVILNLTMNAIEAMDQVTHEPRLLRVTSRPDRDGNALIEVADTGPGLDPAKIDLIFDAFFTTKPDGMGMGLSICRSIVESHGGRLWASPRLPHGSVFHFTVPTSAYGSSNDKAG
jgi:C4-dicarboxylate-specific signal transduction histidine kinase